MAEEKTNKCAHPSCNCMAAQDSKYCGALCEGQSGMLDIACNCGHGSCATTGSASPSM